MLSQLPSAHAVSVMALPAVRSCAGTRTVVIEMAIKKNTFSLYSRLFKSDKNICRCIDIIASRCYWRFY
jgi:hypothetical protein